MTKKDNKKTSVYTYEITMLVHVIADDKDQSKQKLDDQGGIVTKRDVKLLNEAMLYGEEEK